jgi:hypothetical protein
MIRQFTAVAFVLVCVVPARVNAQTESTQLTVNTPSATVHKSPSTGSPVIGKARRGAALEVTRELGDWVKVSWPDSENGFGYVHRTMGRLVRSASGPKTIAQVPTHPGVQNRPQAPIRTEPAPAPQTSSAPRTVYVAPPTHLVGVGGRVTGSTVGYGVSGRAWSRKQFGVQFDLARFGQTNAVTAERVTSVQFAPSVLYSLRDRVTDYVWVRPYLGGGASIRRHTLNGVTPDASVTHNKFALQTFGGGELTFASVPRFALSIDAGYDWSKTPFEGLEVGGFGFGISGHWYFR